MTEKLTRPKTERQKRREIEYHLYHARKYEEQDNRTSYDLCDIHDVKCESKIFDNTVKLDLDNFGYFKSYNQGLERDFEEKEVERLSGEWSNKHNVRYCPISLRDDPPDWCPKSTSKP